MYAGVGSGEREKIEMKANDCFRGYAYNSTTNNTAILIDPNEFNVRRRRHVFTDTPNAGPEPTPTLNVPFVRGESERRKNNDNSFWWGKIVAPTTREAPPCLPTTAFVAYFS
jgi:hypothetical protein